MSGFTAKDVQKLRHATGVGMMDAKKALEETGGDFDKAVDYLREKGLAAAAKRADREATEGAIGSYLHQQAGRPVVGVLVKLASETDFVAKSEDFITAANDIAMHIAWGRPSWIKIEDVPEDVLEKEKELIAKAAANEGKPEAVIPKIVEGRLKKFYEEFVLYEQPFVNQDKFAGTVGEMVAQLAARMGENIHVAEFCRLAVGEN